MTKSRPHLRGWPPSFQLINRLAPITNSRTNFSERGFPRFLKQSWSRCGGLFSPLTPLPEIPQEDEGS